MSIEYEVKVIDIDENKMKKLIKKLGAKKEYSKRLLTRTLFDIPNGFIRVRNEGDTVTITNKIRKDKFPIENEITIKEDYNSGVNFIKSLGFKPRSTQESYREKWNHKLAHEITFDNVPGIPTYMEIDCTSEENLNKLIELFEIDKSKIRYGSFDKLYEEYYGIDTNTINKAKSLTFDNILKEIKPKKNKKLLEKIAKK